jgi:hypothetical protein
VIVGSYGVPGFDNNLPAFALASDNLFNVTGNPFIGAGLGTFTLASEPLMETVFALPGNLWGAWATSFSNLTVPASAYWRLAPDVAAAPNFQNWVAVLPPDFDAGRDWIISFSNLSFPATAYWELLREPLASPDVRNWVAELPPALEMARDWGSGR